MIYLASCLSFLPYVLFYILLISLSLSCSNDARYLWQMVHTRIGDFSLDVPESSDAHVGAATTGPRGAAPTGPRGAAPPPPLPPPPQASVVLYQLLATQNDLMQRLVVNEERCEAHE
jgi:hypothetical protein